MKYADILEFIPQGYELIGRDYRVVRARKGMMEYKCYANGGYCSITIGKGLGDIDLPAAEANATFFSIHEDASIDEKKLCQLISDLEANCNNTIKRREGVVK